MILVNTDPDEPYEVKRGDRIAQLVLQWSRQRSSVRCPRVTSRRRAGGPAASGTPAGDVPGCGRVDPGRNSPLYDKDVRSVPWRA